MRFLIRTGTFVLQLVIFLVLVTLLSQAATYLTAERYAAGDTPSALFPVVVVQAEAAPAAVPQYELLRWPQFTRKDPPPLRAWNSRLPAPTGGFALPVSKGFEPRVQFSTADVADGRQRVEVKVADDDYVVYAAYVTDGAKVVPESFRIWGPSSALLALFPAFVLTIVLSRLVRRWRERAKSGQPG
jgi:hypothetical protein